MFWKTGPVPDEWKQNMISLSFKKNNRKELRNYRGIRHLNSSYKLYVEVLQCRVNKITENAVKEEENYFRNDRYFICFVFAVTQLL
jgi:hypothetical protein